MGLAPVPPALPVVRFETEPGRQMQADWASVGRGDEKLSVFTGTMGWSRAAYIEFCDNERVETLISCHDNAFLAFGGVPVEALLDNMKTVVIERNVYGQGLHRFHPAMPVMLALCRACARRTGRRRRVKWSGSWAI